MEISVRFFSSSVFSFCGWRFLLLLLRFVLLILSPSAGGGDRGATRILRHSTLRRLRFQAPQPHVTPGRRSLPYDLSHSHNLNPLFRRQQAVAGLDADGRQIVARAESEATNYERLVSCENEILKGVIP
ncbi:50S ribosomal protein L29, chloroplastic [Olea europaea subsp. europaea]|uniref:50S ribosomal protein L29, chloroplastic n=1 Tax=Olea europaea subsp. europaea TaxID=158383 RepID=A0A8S0QU65_OLEEU|nr:50S ribosomal protein L29, chloroplastic [Olea europaea subsp. europaea]